MTISTALKTGSEILDKFVKDNEKVQFINNFEELDLTKSMYFMFKNYLIIIDITDKNRPTRMIIKDAPRAKFGYKIEQNFYSKNIPQMLRGIETFINHILRVENYKKERKEKAKKDQANAIAKLKVGDIMYNSWGYKQTNVDFFQITKISGKSAYIRPICGEHVKGSEGFMSANIRPIKDSFCGEEERKVIKAYGDSIYLSSRHGSISLYTAGENGVYSSWYV